MRRAAWKSGACRWLSPQQVPETGRGAYLLAAVFLLFLLAVRSFTEAPPARADESTARIKHMTVSLFPEYDEPQVLVTYRGEFEGVRSFPIEVHFRVPGGAEVRETCAIQPPDDHHLCQSFTTQPAGNDLLVIYTIPLPTFYLEFYYGDIASARKLDYAFRSENPVERLELVVQHPLRARDFTLTPTGSAVTESDQGFLYHHYAYQDVAPGHPLEVKVAYQKADQEPSVPKKTTAILPAPREDQRKELILLGAGLFLTAILVVVIYVAMDRLGARPIVVVRSARAGNNADDQSDELTPKTDGRQVNICRRCGEQLVRDAAICLACGDSAKPNGIQSKPTDTPL